MATTKSRSTKKSSTKSTSRARSPRKADQSLPARAARTVRDRPYASAAIATGAVTAVAAAGAYFFSRSDKSLGELTDDLTDRVKDGLAEAGEKIKSASARAKAYAAELGDKSQPEIAEEAMTLKQTGAKVRKPVDPVIETQSKTGAIAY